MSLITDIAQVRAASTVSVSNTLANWQPYIDEAEYTFIRPAIGTELFSLLEEKAGAAQTDEPFSTALDRIRRPLALYALYLGIDEFSVNLSAQGIQVIATDTHKSAPQYLIQNLKESTMRRAHTLMDLALEYFETNRDAFPGFSPQDPDLFLRCAAEFSRFVDIRSSRRVFLSLKPVIASIERKYIRPTLSDGFFRALKEAVKGTSPLSEDNQAALDLIRPALAHLTIARALQEISIDILDWGVFATAASTFTNVATKQTSNQVRISAMIQANQLDGEAELKALQEFLDMNATEEKYPEYYSSDRYAGPQKARSRGEFPNAAENSFFVA